MNMTTDIYSDKAIDLVIFTVANEQTIREKVWEENISPDYVGRTGNDGLSLFVITIPADEQLYPMARGRRVLPGGYLGKKESLEEASHRILKDRLGLSLKTKIRQLGIFDDPKRDPNDRVLSFAYWGMVNFEDIRKYLGGKEQVGLELVSSHHYMDIFERETGSLENYDGVCRFGNRRMPNAAKRIGHNKTLTKDTKAGRILGLDHDEMVFYAWRQLRHAFDGRLDPFRYLGINPLGDEFRLSDLQDFTEACRGERVQRDLFRRQMTNFDSSFIMSSGRTDSSRPGKPANLYSLSAPPEPLDDIEFP
jgi:ADP-ribose pyrophosphatase YjhB (NUDIX family)